MWDVPDKWTRELMNRFYRTLVNTASVPAALREAQLEQIEELRRQGKSTHPFFWAGFAAMGRAEK